MAGKNTLHSALIAQACTDGWKVGAWKSAAREVFTSEETLALLTGVMDPEGLKGELEEIVEMINEVTCVPDAYKIIVEGKDRGWLHPVVTLELLEVEVTSHVGDDKMRQLEKLWWRLDATEVSHLRVFRMDRFGTISPLMTEDTAHGVMHRFERIDRELESQ